MRSTSASSSAMFVITAETCGSAAMPRNVAPPLKSTRTRLRSSDEWVAASPRTSVRSSSLLPDPVAPMHSPCGPLPPCAASLRSRTTGAPWSSQPIGTRRRSVSTVRRRAHWAAMPSRPGSRPSSSGRPVPARGAAGPAPAVPPGR
jgi:hypothetical protein